MGRNRSRRRRGLVGSRERRRMLLSRTRRVARRHAHADHRNVLVHGGRRPSIVLIRHVARRGHTPVLVLSIEILVLVLGVLVLGVLVLRWHAVVRLGRELGVATIHGIHVLVMVLVVLLLILRHIRRRLPPTRPSRTADHIDPGDSTSSSLYVLPSRQMAVTHRAGLGFE